MSHSRDVHSPPPGEVSDSDIDEEEDPEMVEEEEEVEEVQEDIDEESDEEEAEEEEGDEEEEEKSEEEEEEEEERIEVDMDISDSPIQAHDYHHNDIRQDIKSNGLDGHLRDQLGKEVTSVMNPEGERKEVDIQPRNDRTQMNSRSAASEIGTGTMSPVADSSDLHKRPAIICDFFAKGWCIRGSSCRFVHIKDNPNSSHPQPEGDVAAASCTREARLDEGLRDITERSRSPAFTDPLASSSGTYGHEIQRRNQFHEKRKFPSIQGEDSNLGDSTHAQKLHSSKDDPGFVSSLKDVGRDGQTRNWYTDDYTNSPISKGNSLLKNGLHPEPGFFPNGSILSSAKYSMGNPSSYSSSMEEPARIWSQRMHTDHTSPLVNLSLNSSSSNLLTTGLFPTSRISSWTGFSLPSSYSCLDASPLGTKLLDRSRDYRSSTRSSPFSSSELKNLPSTSMSLRSAELKTKISSNDWEPSIPFRPSFILPPAFLSSSGSQYDPLRGSIELPKLANICFEGATDGNTLHQQIHGESASGTQRPACDGDTNSMSSHNTYQEKVLDNSCYTREHNSPATEAETVGTSVVCQNRTMTVEENPMGPSHLKGSTKPNKTSVHGDSRHQSDSSRHQKDIKVDRFRENNEVDGEILTDGDVQQESKALRNFRAALVDLVKELLKPKWREGCLSKDAHNKIVKKAVEKVLSAFQPHQIPPTIETVRQYLSSCRPKISKLVEAYIEKYGKS